jgi:ADP-ribosylglycohydrolase
LKFTDYHEAIVTAIKAGGDTDTTAAVVGALFGAKYGLKAIDPVIASGVEDADKLVELDSQLYNRSGKSFFPRT